MARRLYLLPIGRHFFEGPIRPVDPISTVDDENVDREDRSQPSLRL